MTRERGIFERPKDSGIWYVRYKDEHGRLHVVPAKRALAVDHSGGDEHGGAKAELLQHGEGLVGHIAEAVVEAEPDGQPREGAGAQEIDRLDYVEHAVANPCQ